MRAYKVFNPDWTCRGFQYGVSGTYEIDGEPIMCQRGFHACKKLVDCFNYHEFNPSNHVAIVEMIGNIVDNGNGKICTNKISVIKEILWPEVLLLCNSGNQNSGIRNSGNQNSGIRNSGNQNSGIRNSGDWNSGNQNSGYQNSGNLNSGDRNSGNQNSGIRNSGDWNSGYQNSGNLNSGDWNSGDRNSGDLNSGDRNSGDLNSGDRNSGDQNSGDWNSGNLNSGDWNSGNLNSGNRNSGDWNSGDGHTGIFNSADPQYGYAFNKLINVAEIKKIYNSKGVEILKKFKLYSYRVRTTTGKFGDYRYMSYKKSWAIFWSTLTTRQKYEVMNIPHFDSTVFEEITGIKT